MSDDFNTEAKKERPDLGAAFIATNKKSPQSYDMSGTIVVDKDIIFNLKLRTVLH